MKPSLTLVIVVAIIGLVVVSTISLNLIRYPKKIIQNFVDGAGDDGGTFRLLYADWCPHCKNVKPLFEQFMGNGSVTINGKKVKCEMIQPEKEPERAKGFNVSGYPTFLYSDAAGKIVEFQGPRTAQAWTEFLKQHVLS